MQELVRCDSRLCNPDDDVQFGSPPDQVGRVRVARLTLRTMSHALCVPITLSRRALSSEGWIGYPLQHQIGSGGRGAWRSESILTLSCK